MQLLLDTHALIWHALRDPRLPAATREAIDDPSNMVFVSAASAWEIATKTRRGKMLPGPLATAFVATVQAQRFELVAIDAQDAQDAGTLSGAHGDPFDRMLAAQALRRDLALVSNDALLDQFGVTRLWS